MNRRSPISSHAQFDDDRYWRFTRQSNLPIGYFNNTAKEVVRWLVVWACSIAVFCVFLTYWS